MVKKDILDEKPVKFEDAMKRLEKIVERLEGGDMPPDEAKKKPTPRERESVVGWIRAFRALEAERNAGDPGVVPIRRLSNAEYNYTVRDLTGVDIRPAREFPVDGAAGEKRKSETAM